MSNPNPAYAGKRPVATKDILLARTQLEPATDRLGLVLPPQAAAVKPAAIQNAAKLHPKEHGAYAILAIPCVTAVVIAGPSLVVLCIVVAALAGFMAHEPLLVAWGHRGRRVQGATPAAQTRLTLLLTLSLVTGCTAFVVGENPVRWALVACAVLACTCFFVAIVGQHRSLFGQLWGVAGLSLPCVPVLLAGGLRTVEVLAVWTTWLIGFWATTLAVRSVIATQKRQSRAVHTILLAFLALLTATGFFFNPSWMLPSLPMLVLSWYLLLLPPPAKFLRRVGWTLVAGTILSALLLIARYWF